MDLGLKGKTMLVSGGAKGIGLGCCRVFAEEGCNIIMNYRSNQIEAEKTAAELSKEYGVKVRAIKADVSKESDVETLFGVLYEEGEQLDFLVNNAADTIIGNTPFQKLSTEEWRRNQEGTLNSAFFMSREFAKQVIENKKTGCIVNVLSKSAFLSSSTYNSPYATSKGGLAVFTRALAKELIAKGIRVNAVIPGYVKTERNYLEGDARTEEKKRLLPLGRFAEPVDIGAAAAFLCSGRTGSTMNGTILDCTGGTLV